MSVAVIVVAALVAVGVSMLLTKVLEGYLKRSAVMDQPNARSLHQSPVPRGGGLAIVAVVLTVHGWLICLTDLVGGWSWWLAAAIFAAIGWLDDLKPRAAWLRLIAQSVVAIVFFRAVLTSADPMAFGFPATLLLGIGAGSIVWTVNLFNFMDGADGFAASQTVLAMTAGTVALIHLGRPDIALLAAVTAAAALGFLRWNWSPATIFLGDSGSYFLGFQFAAFALAQGLDAEWVALWAMLLMPFIVDASLTLCDRIIRRQRVWHAHREHAFQRFILAGRSPVSLVRALSLLNLLVCWPAAAAIVLAPNYMGLAFAIALAIHVICWIVIRRQAVTHVRSESA